MKNRIAAVVVPVVLGGSLMLAPAASAHDQLIKTNPASGAQVTKAPTSLDLTFNESVLTMGNELVVKGPDGKTGKPITPKVSGTVVSAPFKASGNGAYTVTWRVVSADGHPVSGTFNFSLKAAGASGNTMPATSSAAAPKSSNASSQSAAKTDATKESETQKSDSSNHLWIWLLGGLLLVGLACGAVVSRLRGAKGGGSASRSENTDDE